MQGEDASEEDKAAKAEFDDARVDEYLQRGLLGEAAGNVEACRRATPAAAGDCDSASVLKEMITMGTGKPSPSDEDALRLQEKIQEEVFAETAMAAKNAEDLEQGETKRDEQIAAVLKAIGVDLNDRKNAMLKIQIQRGAGAARIASVAQACDAKNPADCKFDAAGEEAEGGSLGIVTTKRFLSEVEETKTKTESGKRKARAARRVARQRLTACKSRAKDGEQQKCAADKKTDDAMKQVRPMLVQARSDKMKARRKIVQEEYKHCMKVVGAEVPLCEAKAEAERKELRKSKPADEKDDEEEGVRAMRHRDAMELLAMEASECSADTKEACKDANTETLKKMYGKDKGKGEGKDKVAAAFRKKLDAMRTCGAPPSQAAEDEAACVEAMGESVWPGKDTDVYKKCKRIAKDTFENMNGKRKDGKDTDMWTKKADLVEKLAKAKFEGTSTKYHVSTKAVDTWYESDKEGACTNAVVKSVKDAVTEAAKEAAANKENGRRRLRDEESSTSSRTVALAQDTINGKCKVHLRTMVTEGDAEVIASAMNVGSAEAKRRLASSGGSWSSTPASEEVPYGSNPEETNMVDADDNDKKNGGGLDMIGYVAIGAGALLLVGVVAGFAYMRGSGGGTSGTRGTSGTSGTSGTTKHVELTCPDHSPFEGRDRVNSLNPAVAVMFDNPMER